MWGYMLLYGNIPVLLGAVENVVRMTIRSLELMYLSSQFSLEYIYC